MNNNRCTCTYETLVKRGFHPIDHSWSCPLNKNFVEVIKELKEPKKHIKLGINPYKEVKYKNKDFKDVWLNEEDRKHYEKTCKSKH